MKRNNIQIPYHLRRAHFVKDEFQNTIIQEEADSLERR